MALNRKYYWLVGGFTALIIYLLNYLYINYIASTKPNLVILALAYPLVLPCHLLGLNKVTNAYVCSIFSIIVYFLIGSLIGFLVYRVRNKRNVGKVRQK